MFKTMARRAKSLNERLTSGVDRPDLEVPKFVRDLTETPVIPVVMPPPEKPKRDIIPMILTGNTFCAIPAPKGSQGFSRRLIPLVTLWITLFLILTVLGFSYGTIVLRVLRVTQQTRTNPSKVEIRTMPSLTKCCMSMTCGLTSVESTTPRLQRGKWRLAHRMGTT